MLKQILVTTAVLAIAAVSVQSASAKTRQIVVEPGASDDLLLKKGKKPNFLIVKTGSGISTPQNGANPGGPAVANFIVAPNGGIPTPPVPNGGPAKTGLKTPELLVAQGSGIATPNGGGSGGNPGQVQPLLLKTSGGIPTRVASADPGPVSAGGNPAPVIANPSEIAAPAVGDNAGATPAGLAASPPPIATPQASDNGGAPPSPPPVVVAKPAPVAGGPIDLYSTLIAHGYGVEIMKFDPQGELVLYVTTPGTPAEADILLVDSRDGKLLERKHVAAYTYADDQAPAYAPRYAPRYAAGDNCDQYNGY